MTGELSQLPKVLREIHEDKTLLEPIIFHVPTNEKIAYKMLEVAQLKPGEIVCDLGSGDGSLLIPAARDFGAHCVGIEINPKLVALAQKKAKKFGLGEDRIKFINDNFFNRKFWHYTGSRDEYVVRRADVVTIYLCYNANELLRKMLSFELRPEARVVSHDFPIKYWEPSYEKVYEDGDSIYMYEMSKVL